MKSNRKLTLIWISSIYLLLNGCATTINDCGASKSKSVVTAAMCMSAGKTQEYNDQLRMELENKLREIKLTESELRLIKIEATHLADDRNAYLQSIRQSSDEIRKLREELATVHTKKAKNTARKEILLEELDKLRTELDTESSETERTKEEIARLKENIAKRQAVITSMAEPIIIE